MLDFVEHSFVQNRIKFRRLDGTMSLVARDIAVKEFNNDPDILYVLHSKNLIFTFLKDKCNDYETGAMLMSLKAGNLGLNMVAASHVILLDLWWNPTTEDQAIDRAHRIGQTRAVTVTRIAIKNTVEERILTLHVFNCFFCSKGQSYQDLFLCIVYLTHSTLLLILFQERKRNIVASALGEKNWQKFCDSTNTRRSRISVFWCVEYPRVFIDKRNKTFSYLISHKCECNE